MNSERYKLILGINASRARSGGAIAHLLGILNESDPNSYGFREVHVWIPPELLEEMPSKPWLVKHSPNALKGSVFRQILWERFSLPKELQKMSCTILLNVDAGTVSRFRPSVTMSRDMLSYEPGEIERYQYFSTTRIRLILLRYIQNQSLKISDGAIFLTRYAADVIQASCGSLSNIACIPHGVGEDFKEVDRVNSLPGGSGKSIQCVYVSPVWEFKHQWVVVEAIYMLREKGYDINITFVGGGKGRASDMLNKKVLSLDPDRSFVTQTGHIPYKELHNQLSKADLFVFASSCENMPNTLVEAMAAGLPIACSNRGPMPEVLEDGGVYFDPEDPDSITDAIEKIISNGDLRRAIATRARKLAEQYSWARCAHETFSYIAKIARKSET